MPHIIFKEASEMFNMQVRMKFYTKMIRRGVFMSPYHHGYFIYEHTHEDLCKVCDSVKESLGEIKQEFYS